MEDLFLHLRRGVGCRDGTPSGLGVWYVSRGRSQLDGRVLSSVVATREERRSVVGPTVKDRSHLFFLVFNS